jgi:hypothetical protein
MLLRKSRGPPLWRGMLTRIREQRRAGIDPGVHPRAGEHSLEAMQHWRESAERVGALRAERKHLLDDNPSSG